jgi:hypothetical protein
VKDPSARVTLRERDFGCPNATLSTLSGLVAYAGRP